MTIREMAAMLPVIELLVLVRRDNETRFQLIESLIRDAAAGLGNPRGERTPKRPTAPRRRKGVVPSSPTRSDPPSRPSQKRPTERCRKRTDPQAEAWLRQQLGGLDGPLP